MTAENPAPEHLEAVNEFASGAAEHLRDSINLADQKAGYLFATVTAVLAYLHSTEATTHCIAAFKEGHVGWGEAVVLIAIICLVAGAIGSLLVVVPRTRGAVRGIVASWAVATFATPHEYAEQVLACDKTTLTRAMLEHCWILSRINSRKYLIISVAIRFSFVGLVAALLYLAFAPGHGS
jgi:hypothetical protein